MPPIWECDVCSKKEMTQIFLVTVTPTTNGFLYDAEIYIMLQLITTTRNMDSALSWMTTHLFYARNNILLSSIYPLNILAITCDDHIYQV